MELSLQRLAPWCCVCGPPAVLSQALWCGGSVVRCLVLTPTFLTPSLSLSSLLLSFPFPHLVFFVFVSPFFPSERSFVSGQRDNLFSAIFFTSTRLNFPSYFLSPILRQPVCRGIRPLQTQKGEPVSRYVLGFLASPRAKRHSSCSLNSHTHPQPLPISIAFQSLVTFCLSRFFDKQQL